MTYRLAAAALSLSVAAMACFALRRQASLGAGIRDAIRQTPPEEQSRLAGMAASGRKVAAVSALRAQAGCSLATATKAIDLLCAVAPGVIVFPAPDGGDGKP